MWEGRANKLYGDHRYVTGALNPSAKGFLRSDWMQRMVEKGGNMVSSLSFDI